MTDARPNRRRSAALLVLAALILPGAALTEDLVANHLRLRSMPRSQRFELAKKLDEFYRLPFGEQAEIRALDERLAELEPSVRARYLNVLHQYQVWLQSRTEAQRRELLELPPGPRLDLVQRLLDASPPPSALTSMDLIAAQTPALNPLGLLDQLHAIRVWLSLEPAQKTELDTKTAASDRLPRLEELGRAAGLEDERPNRLRAFVEGRQGRFPALKKLDSLNKNQREEMIRRAFDVWAIRAMRVEPVESRELDRLFAALPSWLRATFDDLPPNAARHRLAVLYRLLYPEGGLPASVKPHVEGRTPPAAPASPAGPRPGIRPDPGSNPF